MARYRWLVIGAWLVVLLAAAISYPVLQNRLFAPDYGVDGSESARAAEIVQREISSLSAEQDVIVFSGDGVTVDDPAYRATIEAVLAAVYAQPGVSAALVLGISLVFLLAVFRSVLLPVKAVAMNLLATGAALGLLVLVFQQDTGFI